MAVTLPADNKARYAMRLGDEQMPMNELVGQTVTLRYQGEIHCLNCQRLTKKSFSGGFCFPCSQRLAQCDMCFLKPELCHFEQGTCREPDWGQAVCMQDHIVYLANSSGLKVGITRINQIPTRWVDQGAIQALPIFRVRSRYQSGLVEVMFKNHVSDRTDWRKMLKGDAEPIDLAAERDRLLAECDSEIQALQQQFDDNSVATLPGEQEQRIIYPVEQYPAKVSSFNFDKTPEVNGVLHGIKGQYLIFDSGVINIRKFSGYEVEMVV
ncbi:DUF2797 domain-containing protein [Methylophaga sp.]|uniref:DUF2797 domain-containing protein n=1 Tax=Methylophaga sp. TaxID=2024840 RepID=UPI0013FE8DBA|nr:DUF2797 domain-containing protein [Methylophaga sp.]MTI63574.1 DUF2797 domain-containing protein [Methylophaga sp.]